MPMLAATEEMLTMAAPPVSRMIGPSARQARNTPKVLTSKVFSMISSVSSSSL